MSIHYLKQLASLSLLVIVAEKAGCKTKAEALEYWSTKRNEEGVSPEIAKVIDFAFEVSDDYNTLKDMGAAYKLANSQSTHEA